MEQENQNQGSNDLFSKRLRAGRRRTYFFDVRTTRSNDYYLTITESKKRFNQEGYDRHKIFLYKEDFNKFLEGLQETIDHIKTELLPEYDFDEFTRRDEDYNPGPRSDKDSSDDNAAAPVDEMSADPPADTLKEESTPPADQADAPVAEDEATKEEKTEDTSNAGNTEDEEALKWD